MRSLPKPEVWALVDGGNISAMQVRGEGNEPPGPGWVQLMDSEGNPLRVIPPRDHMTRHKLAAGDTAELDTEAMEAHADHVDRQRLIKLQVRRQAIQGMVADLGTGPPELDEVDNEIAAIRARRSARGD